MTESSYIIIPWEEQGRVTTKMLQTKSDLFEEGTGVNKLLFQGNITDLNSLKTFFMGTRLLSGCSIFRWKEIVHLS